MLCNLICVPLLALPCSMTPEVYSIISALPFGERFLKAFNCKTEPQPEPQPEPPIDIPTQWDGFPVS